MPLVIALEIKSKLDVCPLIMHPIAINPSYFFESFEIVTGISNAPGTLKTSNFFIPDFSNSILALL